MDEIVKYIQHNIIPIIAILSTLSGVIIGAYKFMKSVDKKLETIEENSKTKESVEEHEKKIIEVERRLMAGTKRFEQIEKTLAEISLQSKDYKKYFESIDAKLGVIARHLDGDPKAVDGIKVINKTYKDKELEKLKR